MKFSHWLVISLAILNCVNFGLAGTPQFPKGLHFDVEPHLLPSWNTNQASVIQQYLDLLVKMQNALRGSGMILTVDIPAWYDTITVNRNGATKLLSEWIIDYVDRVTIMDYRDFALTRNSPMDTMYNGRTDGMVDGALSEVAYASRVGKKVVIAAELDCFDPPYITFCQEDSNYMERELRTVVNSLKGYSSFDGLAIHHIRAWQSKGPYYTLPNTCDNRRDVFAWWGDIVTNADVRATFASFARSHSLRTVYVETEGLINNNQAQLRDFLDVMYANGVSVEFLFGNADWVFTGNHGYALNLISQSIQFKNSLGGAHAAYPGIC